MDSKLKGSCCSVVSRLFLSRCLSLCCPAAPPGVPGIHMLFLGVRSGSHHWPGPGGRHVGDGAARGLQDAEGHVPHGGAAVQGAAGQAHGHAQEHQPQLRSLYHPQPREEGASARALGMGRAHVRRSALVCPQQQRFLPHSTQSALSAVPLQAGCRHSWERLHL